MEEWFGISDRHEPVYHLVSEEFAAEFAQKHPDIMVFFQRDQGPLEGDVEEKKYLVCQLCGEAFDAIETAVDHEGEDHDGEPCYGLNTRPMYDIVPESEAF